MRLLFLEDRTPELYENAMAMLNLCEAAMVPQNPEAGFSIFFTDIF